MTPPFRIMGIVNATPDSFSDGGRYLDAGAAVAHARELEAEGAAILDLGGESTRPGADPVPADEERRRVVPVIEALTAGGSRAQISIDTIKLSVAEAAVDAGATYVNDVTAFRHDPGLAGLVADRGLDCCLMHMRGEPRTMQQAPVYDDVVSDVKAFLEERMAFAVAEGVPEERIQLDPGIGFGKTVEHNVELLARLPELVALGRPVLVGVSRKSFLGKLTGREVGDRLPATLAANVLAYERGRSCSASTTSGRSETRSRSLLLRSADHEPRRLQRRARRVRGRPRRRARRRGRPSEPVVTIEINGLSLYTHHGVSAAEREIGQRLLLDLRLEVGDCDATITDRVEDTIDYGEVCQVVALVAQQRSYRTLERLCTAIADRLLDQYDAETVWVKASKPEPPIPLPVEDVSVEVFREADG